MINQILLDTKSVLIHSMNLTRKDNKDLFGKIKHIIDNSETHNLCTSTIKAGDDHRHVYYAHWGLILKNGTVKFCAHQDAGSNEFNGHFEYNDIFLLNKERDGYEYPENEVIVDCINNKVQLGNRFYNEILISGYQPIGIYVQNHALTGTSYMEGSQNNPTISVFHTKTAVFGLKYYFLETGSFYPMEYVNGTFVKEAKPVTSSSFYLK